MDGWMNGQMDGWMNDQMDGQMGGQMNGQMDGNMIIYFMDGLIDEHSIISQINFMFTFEDYSYGK